MYGWVAAYLYSNSNKKCNELEYFSMLLNHWKKCNVKSNNYTTAITIQLHHGNYNYIMVITNTPEQLQYNSNYIHLLD